MQASGDLARPRPMVRLFGAARDRRRRARLGPRDLGGVRPKQVLEILLAARGHRVPIDRLAELLWGRRAPPNAAGSCRRSSRSFAATSSPTATAPAQLVVTEAEAYRFATDAVDARSRSLRRAARALGPRADADRRRSLEQALTLVRGDVLEDEPLQHAGLRTLRGSYQGRVLGAHLEAADAALAELDFGAALAHSEAAVALDRFSERAHRLSMLALYAAWAPARGPRSVSRLPHAARRRAGARTHRRNPCARVGDPPPGRPRTRCFPGRSPPIE